MIRWQPLRFLERVELTARAAEGIGRTTVLVTSRFPLTDLAGFRGRGYHHLDVGGLGRIGGLEVARMHIR